MATTDINRSDRYRSSVEDSKVLWQLLDQLRHNESDKLLPRPEICAALLLCNCAAWGLEWPNVLGSTHAVEDIEEQLLPCHYLLPGVVAALKMWGLPQYKALKAGRTVAAFAVRDIEQALAINLSGPRAFSPAALYRRCEIPVPNLMAAVGLMMQRLQIPNIGSRLLLLNQPALEQQLRSWKPALEVAGLDVGQILNGVAVLIHGKEGTSGAANPAPEKRAARGILTTTVANPESIRQLASSLPSDRGFWTEQLKGFANRQCQVRQRRTRQADIDACRALRTSFPNFAEAIEAIEQRLRLQRYSGLAVRLPPLLLVGPPGTGKTTFARAISAALRGKATLIPLERTTAAFALAGSHPSWSSARPGEIAKLLISRTHEGPEVVILDEIDKAQGGAHPVEPTLLGLLDPTAAQQFRDEFLQCELNLTPLSFLATANQQSAISAPLLSRLHPIQIPLPTAEQMPAIAWSVDQELRRESPDLARAFTATSPAVYQVTTQLSPRLLRRAFELAYAHAITQDLQRSRRAEISVAGMAAACRAVTEASSPPRRPIGFIAPMGA